MAENSSDRFFLRLIPFRRPPAEPARKGQSPVEPPGTFDLLGFAHYWARSRKGTWVRLKIVELVVYAIELFLRLA